MKVVFLALALLSAGSAVAEDPPVLACRMGALTKAERSRHGRLVQKLLKAVTGHEALPNGYQAAVDPARMSVRELGEWVGLEARCCPFLDFTLEVSGKGGPIRLRLVGPAGTREFLDKELGITSE